MEFYILVNVLETDIHCRVFNDYSSAYNAMKNEYIKSFNENEDIEDDEKSGYSSINNTEAFIAYDCTKSDENYMWKIFHIKENKICDNILG